MRISHRLRRSSKVLSDHRCDPTVAGKLGLAEHSYHDVDGGCKTKEKHKLTEKKWFGDGLRSRGSTVVESWNEGEGERAKSRKRMKMGEETAKGCAA